MIWQKLKITDWQRVADWCGRYCWKGLVSVLIGLPLIILIVIMASSGLGLSLSETINQMLMTILALFFVVLWCVSFSLGIIGLILSFFYIIQSKYQYSKAVQFQNFVVIFSLSFLAYIAMSASKQHALVTYRSQFVDTSQSIFEQLNANSQSIHAADAQIKQLIEKYNSSNNTLKVTRIITHSAQIYSTTSDREGLGHPVVQFQLRKQRDGRLFWQCQVVRAGTIDSAKLMWCAPDASYGSNART